MCFLFGHDLGRSQGLEFTIVTGMWGSWRARLAVRSAGATSVRCTVVSDRQTDMARPVENSGVFESLPVILGVLSVPDRG